MLAIPYDPACQTTPFMAITTTACFVLSEFCQILVLLPKLRNKEKDQFSSVLLGWYYLSAWFRISQQSGENWVLSFKRGRSESKPALGHMKKRQRRRRAGTSLKAGETPEELAFLLRVLLEGSGQVWSHPCTLWSLSGVWLLVAWFLFSCFQDTSELQITGSQIFVATMLQLHRTRVLSDSVCSPAFWCVQWLQCIAAQFILLFSHAPACSLPRDVQRMMIQSYCTGIFLWW